MVSRLETAHGGVEEEGREVSSSYECGVSHEDEDRRSGSTAGRDSWQMVSFGQCKEAHEGGVVATCSG
jgi:hypothetical protein